MEFLSALWLPIVVAAVLVFVASSIIHMVLPVHKNDYGKLMNEDKVLEAMRTHGVQPGQYMFPRPASMKDCASPEMLEKFRKGPVGNMVVMPSGAPAIGKSLFQWFVFSLVVGLFSGYVAWHTLQAQAGYLEVFRITGAVAFASYALGQSMDSIWKGVRWSTTIKFMFDGMVYALITGGSFGWLWPKVAGA